MFWPVWRLSQIHICAVGVFVHLLRFMDSRMTDDKCEYVPLQMFNINTDAFSSSFTSVNVLHIGR